jgi:hypothetical protein
MIFLLVEFIDELVFGLQDAAWPLIRSDLGLNYAQIGILLSIPGVLANGRRYRRLGRTNSRNGKLLKLRTNSKKTR